MNLSKTIVLKKVLFTKRKLKMRKISAIILQMVIFIVAWIVTTPDVAQDNTYLFGLIGDVEVVRGNSIWVMSIAAVLSAFNIWVWWPKKSTTPSEKPAESTKSTEAKIEDPIVPKMD